MDISKEDIFNEIDKAMNFKGATVEMALLYLMRKYTFDLEALLKSFKGSSSPSPHHVAISIPHRNCHTYIPVILVKRLNVSFSNVKFDQIAPLVGLDPREELYDVKFFEVHRARITDELFLQILKDN
jgi:hypothetical protein